MRLHRIMMFLLVFHRPPLRSTKNATSGPGTSGGETEGHALRLMPLRLHTIDRTRGAALRPRLFVGLRRKKPRSAAPHAAGRNARETYALASRRNNPEGIGTTRLRARYWA